MSHKQVRAYLFKKSYTYTVFQEYINKANRKEKAKLRKRITKILLLKSNASIRDSDFQSLLRHDGKLSVYIRIEHEITQLIKKRKEQGYFDLVEYEYALLKPAIERVAGEDLCNIENDREFDQQLVRFKILYHYWYYQTAAKYRLPTLRIVPFLLRLLQC